MGPVTTRTLHALDDAHVAQLHALYQDEWWTTGRTLAQTRALLAGSDAVVALVDHGDDALLAFARALSDGVCKALVFDVIVAPGARGAGLGRAVMEALLAHPAVAPCAHVELYARDEQLPFYARLGFAAHGLDVRLARRDRPGS